MADHSIRNKVVLIAGGAKNLGGLIARDLAAKGAKAVVIHYNSASSRADAEATVAAVQAAGAWAVALQADLTSATAVERLFADAVAAVGRPDIAINTVGKVLKKPLLEISEAEYDEMSAVNSKAAFFFLKEAGRHVNDNGKIVTLVTSLLGAFTPFYSSYAGTKAPVEHFTRAAAKEFGARGISVTAGTQSRRRNAEWPHDHLSRPTRPHRHRRPIRLHARRRPAGGGRRRHRARHQPHCPALCQRGPHAGLAPGRPHLVRRQPPWPPAF